MQRERVEDQYPWTWEIPLGALCLLALVIVLACQVGRSVANWFAGAGWVWPAPSQLFMSVPGLVAGNGAAGVPVTHAAAAATLWLWMAIASVLTLAGGALAAVWAWRRWGTPELRGMASVTEARAILGVDRLHRVRHIVRPDLYPSRRRGKR